MSEIKEPYLELDGQVSLSKSVAGVKCKGGVSGGDGI
jgi:hypothetical protein